MSFRVVLDADVLVPAPLCDLLLRIAEKEMFDPLWSDRILEEVRDALVGNLAVSPQLADRRIAAMRRAFDGAVVDPIPIDLLEPSMANDEGDRHVLAAAVVSGADAIVTSNVRHFPVEACAPFAVEPIHPDDFLVMQLDLDVTGVGASLVEQAADLRNPPMTPREVAEVLRPFAPEFVNQAIARLNI